MKLIKNGLWALLLVLFAVACTKDDDITPEDAHEEEVITTLKYILTNDDDIATFVYRDMNNDGDTDDDGDTLILDSLVTGITYTGEILLLNELEEETDTISIEVLEEATEHEFFYDIDIDASTITKTDLDSNDNAFGSKTTLAVDNLVLLNGTIKVLLKHEPTKPNTFTYDDADGETDIDVTFTPIKTYSPED